MRNNLEAESREVDAILRSCERYWKGTNVPRDAIKEMRLELEGHLRDAVADGKPLVSVVGGDVESFAEDWAREFRAPVALSDVRSFGPALLGFAAAVVEVVLSFSIATSAQSISCCPRVVESRPIEGGVVLFWFTIGVAAAAFAGAVALAARRPRAAAFLWGAAAPMAIFTAGSWIVTILLLFAVIGARRQFARAAVPGLS